MVGSWLVQVSINRPPCTRPWTLPPGRSSGDAFSGDGGACGVEVDRATLSDLGSTFWGLMLARGLYRKYKGPAILGKWIAVRLGLWYRKSVQLVVR